MKQDKWTQQLHDKLAEHEAPVPADLWADIEAVLPPRSSQSIPAQPSRKARIVALHRWAAAAVIGIVFAGGGLVWWSLDRQQTEPLISMAEESPYNAIQKEPPYDAIQKEVEQDAAAPLPSREEVAEDQNRETNVPPVKRAQANSFEGKSQTPPPPLDGNEVAAHEAPPTLHAQTEVASPSQTENFANQVETPASQTQSGGTHIELSSPDTPITSSGHCRTNHRPALGLYAMNGLGSQDNSNAVMMADALAKNYANTYAVGHASSRQAPIFLTGFEERQHHYQPLSFGLSVSYPLTERFSLTSGVVYTRLRSDFTQIIRSQQFTKEQTLHYVGVPVGLNYRLWRYKDFRAYFTVGMQADWNVKTQLNAEGVEQEMSRDRLQWSANGSLGLQYDVLPQFSLYAEPGINHYLDNGSAVQNFFKDKPTSLKLQFGIRLNLQKLQ